jgi:hypothetical protein
MKMGGGDWSKDGSDTKTLSKRMAGYKMAGRKVNPDMAASVGKGVKVPANEETQDLDETSTKKAMDYLSKSFAPREAAAERSARATRYNPGDRKEAGRLLGNKMKGAERARKVISKAFSVKEEAEDLEELSNATLGSYERKSGSDRNRDAGNVMAKRKQLGTNTVKVASTEMNKARPKFEEVEVIDEALDAAARYGQHHVAIKELLKSIDQHVKNHKDGALKHKDYTGKKGVHWGHVGDLAQVHSQLADIHDRLAQQGEYKSTMVGESVEDYDVEQIAELSNKTLNTYRGNAYNDYLKKSANRMPGEGETDAMKKRMKSLNLAADKLTKEDHDFIESLNNNELDEARGRPRKVPLPVGDVEPEPRQHVMQQLQRAKLSMRGGEDVVFKDGKKAHVSGAHAARVLTKYAGMKPGDKEDYQKKIGASHEAFKEHM